MYLKTFYRSILQTALASISFGVLVLGVFYLSLEDFWIVENFVNFVVALPHQSPGGLVMRNILESTVWGGSFWLYLIGVSLTAIWHQQRIGSAIAKKQLNRIFIVGAFAIATVTEGVIAVAGLQRDTSIVRHLIDVPGMFALFFVSAAILAVLATQSITWLLGVIFNSSETSGILRVASSLLASLLAVVSTVTIAGIIFWCIVYSPFFIAAGWESALKFILVVFWLGGISMGYTFLLNAFVPLIFVWVIVAGAIFWLQGNTPMAITLRAAIHSRQAHSQSESLSTA